MKIEIYKDFNNNEILNIAVGYDYVYMDKEDAAALVRAMYVAWGMKWMMDSMEENDG